MNSVLTGFWVALAFLAAVAAVSFGIESKGIASENVAAWVQVIGAIVALSVTGYQVQRLAKIERERAAAPLTIAIQGCVAALHLYDSFKGGLDGRDVQSWANSCLQPTSLSSVTSSFSDISLRDMPTAMSVSTLLSARHNAQFLVERIKGARNGDPGWDEDSVTTRTKLWACWKTFEDEQKRILNGRKWD